MSLTSATRRVGALTVNFLNAAGKETSFGRQYMPLHVQESGQVWLSNN